MSVYSDFPTDDLVEHILWLQDQRRGWFEAMLDAADTISEELAIAEGLLERCNLEELQSNTLAKRPQDFIAALRHLVRSSRLLACAVAEDMREELAP